MDRLKKKLLRRKRWTFWTWIAYILLFIWTFGFLIPVLYSSHTFKVFDSKDGKICHVIERTSYFGFEKTNHFIKKR